jgi:hypothetical protein
MTNYEFEALLTPLLKSKIQRLQNKYKLELEGLGVCFFQNPVAQLVIKSQW